VESAILSFGKARRLGGLPPLEPLTPTRLAEAFRVNFRLSDFISSGPVIARGEAPKQSRG
jgi:hypothetical protein